jgi:hypothetical protein
MMIIIIKYTKLPVPVDHVFLLKFIRPDLCYPEVFAAVRMAAERSDDPFLHGLKYH